LFCNHAALAQGVEGEVLLDALMRFNPFETFTESSRLNSAAIVLFRAFKIALESVLLFANTGRTGNTAIGSAGGEDDVPPAPLTLYMLLAS
jgi:hypothetical protein